MQPLLGERARKRTVAGPSQEGSLTSCRARGDEEDPSPGWAAGCAGYQCKETHSPPLQAWVGPGDVGWKNPAGTGRDPGLTSWAGLAAAAQYSPGLQDWGPGGPWPCVETTLVLVVACRCKKTTSFYWKSRFLICADVVGVFSAT